MQVEYGTVKWISWKRGYGVIESARDKCEVVVRLADVCVKSTARLSPGLEVAYTTDNRPWRVKRVSAR